MMRHLLVLASLLLTLVSSTDAKEIAVQLYEDPNVSLTTVAQLVESATAGDTLALIGDGRVVHALVLPNRQPATAPDVIEAVIDSLKGVRPRGNAREEQSSSLQIIELARKHSRVGMLDWKDYGDGSFQFVFVRGGSRYTVYSRDQFITFWIRPDGTTGPSASATVRDSYLDDTVDFGSSDQMGWFNSGVTGERIEHPEYRPSWQEILDRVQDAAIAFLRESDH